MNSIVLHSSVPLDNEHCLIVNSVLFANLSQMIVFFYERIPAMHCRCLLPVARVLAHHRFELLAFFVIAAVINPVGVKEKNVSRDSSM